MKSLLLIISLALYASAGWITSVQSAFDKSIDTEKRSLSTYGISPRAYVFTVEAI